MTGSSGGWRARAHVRVRRATCPVDTVVDLLPRSGRVLDLGCGHGVLSLRMAELSAQRSVTGVDVDAAKISEARRAASLAGLGDRTSFEVVPADWRPEAGSFDAVLVVDVLYLLGSEPAADLLRAAAGALRPGGRLVVKEMGDRPRWKRRWAVAQETVAVRLLGLTRGTVVHLLAEREIVDVLTEHGLVVSRHDLGRGYPHPHVAWVGTRAGAGASAVVAVDALEVG